MCDVNITGFAVVTDYAEAPLALTPAERNLLTRLRQIRHDGIANVVILDVITMTLWLISVDAEPMSDSKVLTSA